MLRGVGKVSGYVVGLRRQVGDIQSSALLGSIVLWFVSV